MTYYRHPLGWICENSEQLTAELFVNRSTVGPINVGGRVLFPCDGERVGMFICLHVNEHSGGGVGRPLLEFRSCEAVRFVNTSAHGGTVLRASTYICIWWEEKTLGFCVVYQNWVFLLCLNLKVFLWGCLFYNVPEWVPSRLSDAGCCGCCIFKLWQGDVVPARHGVLDWKI